MQYPVTNLLRDKTTRLSAVPEVTPGDHGFSMFNSGSTEVEVSEFLYSLVRMIKPHKILETGTHYGISSAYMGQALKDNDYGHLTTLEINPVFFAEATKLHDELGLSKQVRCIIADSREWSAPGTCDLLFLDSEPQYRFDEFVRFWPQVNPGGFILIHDLHPHLGYTGTTVNEMYCWPYGDFRAKIGKYIKQHEVQVVTFRTPRGFTLFQKRADDFAANSLLRGDL